MRALPPERGPARAMLAVMIALALLSAPDWARALREPGIDFYQFWALAKCQREAGFRLGTPYAHVAAYQQRLEALAAASGDENLRAVVAFRDAPDTTGTPLSYFVMGLLPGPYTAALQGWRGAQFLALVAAFLVLAWPFASPLVASLLALASALAFDPLLLDVRTGNLNALELLGLVACAEWIRRAHATRVLALLAPVVLVLLMLMKPTVGLAAALLGLGLLARVSWPLRGAAIASALAALVILAAPPVVLFGAASVWHEWWSEIFGSTTRLAYGVDAGNYSSVAWLATLAGTGIGGMTLAVVFTAILSALAALGFSARAARRAGEEMLRDPLGAAAAGVIALFGLSPLVWSHYYVLAILPALWLCRASESRGARVLGWGALLLVADPLRRVQSFVPLALIDAVHALGWLPLWAGLLLVLRERARAPAPQPAVATAPFITPS